MNHLELYKVFQKVAECESFSGAAKELFVTQPAVSQAVKQLEEELNCELFLRNARGVSLTDEGKLLYGYVNSALNLIVTGEDKLSRMQALRSGDLTIGAGDTITKQFLMPYIDRFHTLYPDILIKVTNRTSTEIVDFLRNGTVDIAFVNLPLSAEGIKTIDCMEIEDIFVAGERFRFLEGKALTYEELSSYPLIMLEPRANSRKFVDSHFLKNGVSLQPEIELGAYDLLLDFAEIGLGIACIIREFAGRQKNLFEVRLQTPLPRRHIGICYLSSIRLSPSARKFIDLIVQS